MLYLLTAALLAAPALDDGHEGWLDLQTFRSLGAPATVALVDSLSDRDRTTVRVEVPGFWSRGVVGGDGKLYSQLDVPGWHGTTTDLGAPELPVLRFWLALPPGAEAVVRDPSLPLGAEIARFELSELAFLSPGTAGPLIYPVHEPALDGNPAEGTPDGVPPAFQFAPEIYFGQSLYPASPFDALVTVQTLNGGARAALVELRPFQWDPVAGELVLMHEFQLAFDHPDPSGAVGDLTRPNRRLMEQLAINFEQVEQDYPVVPAEQGYAGRYLILAPAAQLEVLLPLIAQRRLTGLDVEFRALESLPGTEPEAVRAVLGEWLQAAPNGSDSFALLVGDVETIPLHPPTSVGGTASDGPYAAPLDNDPDRALYVGRLSVDDALDLESQVAKIVATERKSSGAENLEQLGLALHGHTDLGLFSKPYEEFGMALSAAAAETAIGYQPQLFFGSQNVAQQQLLDLLDQGLGSLLYRGQGTTDAWPGFGAAPGLTAAQVRAFDNQDAPIHWSLAPSTAAIDADDSLAEAWMAAPGGASAVLGALGSTAVEDTHRIGEWLVAERAAGVPLALLLPAVSRAREAARRNGAQARLQERFLLLGDPASSAPVGNAAAAAEISIDGDTATAGTTPYLQYKLTHVVVTASTANGGGAALADALVSLTIGKDTVGPDGELLPPPFQADVHMTDGVATIPFEVGAEALAAHPGYDGTASLNLVFGDGSVRFVSDSIEVLLGSFENLGGEVGSALVPAPRLSSTDVLEAGETVDVLLENASPSTLSVIFIAFQSNPIPIGGGVLHAAPSAISLAFFTDPVGEAALALGPLPFNTPPGFELVLQAVVAEPSAPFGWVLSNALKGAL